MLTDETKALIKAKLLELEDDIEELQEKVEVENSYQQMAEIELKLALSNRLVLRTKLKQQQ